MKNKLLKLLSLGILGGALAIGLAPIHEANAVAESKTYSFGTIPTKGWSTSGGKVTLNNLEWTYTSSTYIGGNSSYIQIGSSKNPQTTEWTISLDSAKLGTNINISSISVTAYTTATTASCSIYVGGVNKLSQDLSTTSSSYKIENLNVTSGEIKIGLTGSSTSKAMYLKDVSIIYTGEETINEYTVSYDANGGTGTMLDSSSPYEEGTNITVLPNEFTAPSGKEFAHFNTKQDDTGTSYNPGETFSISKDTTLYAIWSDVIVEEGSYYAPVTSLSELSAGNTVLLGRENGAYISVNSGFESNSSKTSTWLNSTSLQYANNKFYTANNYDFEPLKLGVSSGNWTFSMSDGSYIGVKNGATDNNTLISAKQTDIEAQWNIAIDANGTKINNVNNTTAGCLKFNTSGNKFSNFKSTSSVSDIKLYKLVGSVGKVTLDKTKTEIYVDSTSTVKVSKCENFNASSFAWSIIDGADKIEITAGQNTNEVTFKGLSEGNATLEVTVNDLYKVTCDVTIKAKTAVVIEEGQYFITDAKDAHLMSASMLDTTNVDFTNISNLWSIEYANKGDNSYYISSSNGYLTRKQSIAGSGSNTELALSAQKYDHFYITGDATNGYSVRPSSSTGYSLGLGTDGEWRTISGTPKVHFTKGLEFETIGYEGTLVKSTYNVGDDFDPTGLTFYVKYSGVDTHYALNETIKWNKIAANSTTAVGIVKCCGADRTVTVSGLTVTNYVADSIKLSGDYKTTYKVGERVDITNLVVTLVMKDGESSKDVVLTNADYDYSPKVVESSTTKIYITYLKDTSIVNNFDITVSASTYVATNYVSAGERIVIAKLDSDAYGIKGGEELSFNNGSPDHTSFDYSPAGLEEFVVENTSYSTTIDEVNVKAYALKNVKTGKYLRYNGKKFGYPEVSSITCGGSESGYDFKYFYNIEGKTGYLEFTSGVSDGNGGYEGFYAFEYLEDGNYNDYIVASATLSSDGSGEIEYTVYTQATSYSGIEYSVDVTWSFNGTIIIYLPSNEEDTISEINSWIFQYNKTYASWSLQPYSDMTKYCSYNKDGDGNFAFYSDLYDEITIYRNNTYALSNTVTSISVNEESIKTEYTVGDQFAWTGLEINAYYGNGISSTLPLGSYEISNPDMSTSGAKTITVSYGALSNIVTDTFEITVNEKEAEKPTIVSLEITKEPTKVYELGDTVTFDGELTAHMSDGTTKILTEEEYTLNCSGTSTTGVKTVTITAKNSGGKNVQYQISVIEPVVTLVSLELSGQTTTYYVGDTFSFDGVAKAVYSNGNKKIVNPTTVSDISTSTTGTFEATITYSESGVTVSAKYDVVVKEVPVITSVEISGQQLAFEIGESFSKGNMVVTCHFSDGSTSNQVPYSIDSSKFDSTKEGTCDITVNVSGYETPVTYTVNIVKAKINEIVLQYTSSKTDAKPGDTQELIFKKPVDANPSDFDYVSSNENVATVSIVEGKAVVTYHDYGKATITITPKAEIGGTGKATYEVTVSKHVTGITLNKTSESMFVGDELTLVATISPEDATNKNVNWSSSNSSVAKVDSNGKVTAIAVGTAFVKAKSVDGNFEATCEITVNPTPVTGVTLNKNEASVDEGKTVTLIATVGPNDATNKEVAWSSSNTAVATVDANGKVTGVKEGTATITVTTVDGGFTATCVVTVNKVENVGPVDNDDTETNTNTDENKETVNIGCNGSVIASSAIVSIVTMLGVVFLDYKKRNN